MVGRVARSVARVRRRVTLTQANVTGPDRADHRDGRVVGGLPFAQFPASARASCSRRRRRWGPSPHAALQSRAGFPSGNAAQNVGGWGVAGGNGPSGPSVRAAPRTSRGLNLWIRRGHGRVPVLRRRRPWLCTIVHGAQYGALPDAMDGRPAWWIRRPHDARHQHHGEEARRRQASCGRSSASCSASTATHHPDGSIPGRVGTTIAGRDRCWTGTRRGRCDARPPARGVVRRRSRDRRSTRRGARRAAVIVPEVGRRPRGGAIIGALGWAVVVGRRSARTPTVPSRAMQRAPCSAFSLGDGRDDVADHHHHRARRRGGWRRGSTDSPRDTPSREGTRPHRRGGRGAAGVQRAHGGASRCDRRTLSPAWTSRTTARHALRTEIQGGSRRDLGRDGGVVCRPRRDGGADARHVLVGMAATSRSSRRRRSIASRW